MKKEDYWEAVCKRYPKFRDPEHIVKQRARGLKALLDQAFDLGHDQGFRNGKAAVEMEAEKKKKGNSGLDILGDFFK